MDGVLQHRRNRYLSYRYQYCPLRYDQKPRKWNSRFRGVQAGKRGTASQNPYKRLFYPCASVIEVAAGIQPRQVSFGIAVQPPGRRRWPIHGIRFVNGRSMSGAAYANNTRNATQAR